MLREVAFDRDSDVSWDSFVRRYNADLANDYGNLLNRSLAMTSRYLDGERPAPTDGELARAWRGTFERYGERSRPACSTRRSRRSGTSSGEANRFVDAQQPWVLAKSAKDGDADAEARLRGVLGDLLEACRVVTFAAAPFIPAAAERARRAARRRLGLRTPTATAARRSPSSSDGARSVAGRIGEPAPLFPRLEADPEGG